ncbi:MAG TPA: hypothetical protein VIQ77_15285 [Mucilaginibacter sp.]
MFLKRTSPNLSGDLPAATIEIGDKIPFNNKEIVSALYATNQAICRFYVPPAHHKKRIPFLEKAGELIADALNNPFDYALGHIFWHRDKLNKDGSYRKVRRERRESMTVLIGRFIMHSVNLATMTLGFPSGKNFHHYDYEGIAKAVGINLSEVKRTMARFIQAGYVKVEPVREKRMDGSYRSKHPIIRISERLFYDLGFDKHVILFHVERAKKALTKALNSKQETIQLFTPPRSPAAKNHLKKIMRILAANLSPNTS